MVDLKKYHRIAVWLINQRDKAKAAWSIVVLLAGLLGYQSVTTNQKTETLQPEKCPQCNTLHNTDQ